MAQKKPAVAELVHKKGEWFVKITLRDGFTNFARRGSTQHIVYDDPQRVPTHLRSTIVPRLLTEATRRNLGGKY